VGNDIVHLSLQVASLPQLERQFATLVQSGFASHALSCIGHSLLFCALVRHVLQGSVDPLPPAPVPGQAFATQTPVQLWHSAHDTSVMSAFCASGDIVGHDINPHETGSVALKQPALTQHCSSCVQPGVWAHVFDSIGQKPSCKELSAHEPHEAGPEPPTPTGPIPQLTMHW
jgi:hypothetical protein